MAEDYLENILISKTRIIFCIIFTTTFVLQSNGTVSDRSVGTPEDVGHNYYRLPKHVIPKHYKLKLVPNLSNKTYFDGTLTITVHVLETTKRISLHSNKLEIRTITVSKNDSECIGILSTNHTNDKRELMVINFKYEITQGFYDIFMEFSGRLDNGIVGFYASKLKNGRTMVASKFQPTYARQAFPCFDEPDFKATFAILLVKPESYVALSNMNEVQDLKRVDPVSKLETVEFATSAPMSTYLACFVVCDFDFKELEIDANGIGKNFKLRSFAQKNETHKVDFAQDIGKRATEFYIKYYEVAFPLPKLDMIAIPDYSSGATEHWGLITYRETQFLIDEATASTKNKLNVANTIAHELAHMWFGNLVTMKWWDEVWLNEGFASYMQVKSLNTIEPSWAMLDQFLTSTLHPALITDAKLSSHPIVQTVETPDQITAIFDLISYKKGASILRMLEGFIGEENFRQGVSDYLKKHKFGNTVTGDLLNSLEPYVKADNRKLNITQIMDTWTKQMGYPVLQVTKTVGPNSYIVKQKRFLLDPEAGNPDDSVFNYRWFVPVTYKTNKAQNSKILWFPNTTVSVTLKLSTDDTWVKLNNDQVGYYRVNYEDEMWQKLILELQGKSDKLTPSDRAHLINDAFELAASGDIPYHTALDLSTYLSVELDLVPWQTAATQLYGLSDRLMRTTAFTNLQEYVQKLIQPLYEKQSWEKRDLSVSESLLRSLTFNLALRFQLPDAETRVRSLFLSWLQSHDSQTPLNVESDIRDLVYFYGMKSASQVEWDKLWDIYLNENDAQEKNILRRALSAPRDAKILLNYLNLAWDENKVRSQDYLNVLSAISNNPAATDIVWSDVRIRWLALVDRFTLNSRYLGSLIPSITDNFSTEEKLREMESFFKQYPDAGAGETARKQALETVRNNIKWAKTHQNSIAEWLLTNQNKKT